MFSVFKVEYVLLFPSPRKFTNRKPNFSSDLENTLTAPAGSIAAAVPVWFLSHSPLPSWTALHLSNSWPTFSFSCFLHVTVVRKHFTVQNFWFFSIYTKHRDNTIPWLKTPALICPIPWHSDIPTAIGLFGFISSYLSASVCNWLCGPLYNVAVVSPCFVIQGTRNIHIP